MNDVLGVEFEIEPGPAIGNDPAGKKQLAAGVGLALVMIEEDARRAVHLGNDYALGAVDDERSVRGHQRHVAHVDDLLLDVLHRLCASILVGIEHDEAKRDLELRRISHVALLALLDIIFRLFQFVVDELEFRGFAKILDREDRLEDTLDAFAVHRLGLVTRVQEKVVGGFLNLDEVRHFKNFADLAKVLAETLLANIRRCHG